MEQQSVERRNGYTELYKDIAVIKNELQHIKTMLEEMPKTVSQDDFRSHVFQDRVFYTIITGLLLVVLKGVFF